MEKSKLTRWAEIATIIGTIIAIILFFRVGEGQQDKTTSTTEISFDHEEYSLGILKNGQIVSHEFKFKNTGNSPLYIENAVGDYGCVTTEYPKKPIEPGNQGIILIKFNAGERSGYQRKKITIIANTIPARTELEIQAVVYSEKEYAGEE